MLKGKIGSKNIKTGKVSSVKGLVGRIIGVYTTSVTGEGT